jgi:hypothetical protein
MELNITYILKDKNIISAWTRDFQNFSSAGQMRIYYTTWGPDHLQKKLITLIIYVLPNCLLSEACYIIKYTWNLNKLLTFNIGSFSSSFIFSSISINVGEIFCVKKSAPCV